MTQEKRLLEFGDTVYAYNEYGVRDIFIIGRVTKTMAIAIRNGRKFKRELDSFGNTRMIGDSPYITKMNYSLENKTIKELYHRKTMLHDIKNYKFDQLTYQELKEVHAFCERYINKP